MRIGGRGGWSLGGRLARRILIGAGLVWTIVLGVALAVMWHEMGEFADDALGLKARVALAALERGIPPEPEDDETRARLERPGAAATPAPWPPLAADGFAEVGGWAVARRSGPDGFAVEIGQTLGERRDDFLEAARVWLLLTVPLLLTLGPLVVLTVRGAMAPVVGFAAGMERRRASDLSPTPEAGLPVELLPIPRALNRYLSRIDGLLRSERAFSANAAHEIRTPLAVVAAEARLIADGRAGPGAAPAILEAVDRLRVTVDRLLELARAETLIGQPGEGCDLARVLTLLVREAPAGRVRFDDGDIETLPIEADAEAAAIVLGNLLRNAVEHGAGAVRVALRPGPRVEIANEVAPGARFHEPRRALGAGSSGSGLGLSIARAIAERYGWRLDLTLEDGRAVATLDLGAPPSAPA
ncbi:histidine kinase dimerization/phospho-acceptor domain-containing protein [Amaricoccus solimangrovi]|uniref:histidine kinase n=1 Tax=Amaricoccus solimangrovi TaxID=2589815 RepID=A0A501WPV4_9RHOB|nr:histidine kinase dimerization/phospho-acceptor domain-containing protein [Amaricoccus solimangrovi]TPE50144.1 hypothetical protein FJM51_12195 [Amaricoccus solimangrovi]